MAKLKRFLPLAFVLCLFGLVFGANLRVIERCGTDLPYWDQWDAESKDLFLPYFQHHLGFLDLFKAQNEHRIFFTRVLNLALLLAGGQWDMRVQCVVNAAIHGTFAIAVFLVGRHLLAPRWQAALFAACALVFGLPISWFNILNGFQSQFYFLLWLSMGTIALLCFARTGSGLWWAGLVLGVLANFSMASGLLAAAAVAGVLLLRVLRRHTTWGDIWPTLTGCAVAVAVGLFTRVTMSWHVPMYAKSLHDFAYTVIFSMQWPNDGPPWYALVVFAPVALILWQALRHRAEDMRSENLLLAASLWLLLQIAATGYARGAGAPWLASRYLDIPAFGLIVNGVILAFLLDRVPLAGVLRLARQVFCLIWLLVVGQGLWHHVHLVINYELPDVARNFQECECNARAYMITGDFARLDGQTISYPSAEALRERLSHPEIRAILPASVRPPLPVSGSTAPAGAFVANNDSLPKRPSLFKYARVWSSPLAGASQGTWESSPFTPAFDGYLRIDMAGYPGTPGLGLLVRDASTGAPLAEVRPTRQPRESWRSAYVRVPRRPLVLTAANHNSPCWFAFSEPVEMSMLSYWTLRLVKQSSLILFFSAASTLLLCLPAMLNRLRSWPEFYSRLLGSSR